jgi:tetratricopeptide (TPR) repeat protein
VQQEPTYDDTIIAKQKKSASGISEQKDELYDDAVRLVIETSQASVSIIQRRMRLGYTRAARLIDMMEQEGIVGSYCGSKPREILVNREEWLRDDMEKNMFKIPYDLVETIYPESLSPQFFKKIKDEVSNEDYYKKGINFYNKEEYNKAIKHLTNAILFDPTVNTNAYLMRGSAYLFVDKLEEGITDLSKLISLEPKSVKAYYNRGKAYGRKRKYDKAIEDFSKAIEIDPNYEEAYLNRGVSYRHIEEFEKAIVDYSKAIEIDPNYEEAYFNRGVVYAKIGELDKAIVDYSKVIEMAPVRKNAYFNRGLDYSRIQEFDKAIEDFSKVVEIDPEDKDAKNEIEKIRKLKPLNG